MNGFEAASKIKKLGANRKLIDAIKAAAGQSRDHEVKPLSANETS